MSLIFRQIDVDYDNHTIWGAKGKGKQYCITFNIDSGYRASWKPLSDISQKANFIGDEFRAFELAKKACEEMDDG